MRRSAAWILAAALVPAGLLFGQSRPAIPAFWDADLLHDYELPLATPAMTPAHVSRDYYYALPERRLFKSYPIYHPDREPAGYLDRLRAAEPAQVFDAADLTTDADWIAAGRDVFEMPIDYGGPIAGLADVRDPKWYTAHRIPVTTDGVMPLYDILNERVGTDPALTMTTQRGTGYYKIPSLKGVWYRGPFEHSGSVATLEDWFDPRRLRDDYVPTGFKGLAPTRAVPGHVFGLSLSADDRAALIAFLKTL